MSLRFRGLFAPVVVALTLGACQMQPAPPPRDDPAAAKLAAAALTASNALKTLSEIENRQHPDMSAPSPDLQLVPAELRQPVRMTYIGPLDNLVAKLANIAGYAFVATGPRGSVPIIVHIESQDQPLVDVLRDAGLQAGSRATIEPNLPRHEVELRYVANP